MPAIDQFSGFHRGQTDPYVNGEAVPVDVEFDNVSSGLIVDVATTLTVTLMDDSSFVIPMVAAGIVHPVRCKKVTNFGSATVIASVY